MKKAFTMIELAIVLVIIGLIIAGIVGGQELIKQSKINAQVSQMRYIATSVNTFRIKYNAVPGDYRESVAVLGSAYAGDGDEIIDRLEPRVFWENLSLSKIVDESFTQYTGGDNYHPHYMRMKYVPDNGPYFLAATMGSLNGGTLEAAGTNHRNFLRMMLYDPNIGFDEIGAFEPEYMYSLDAKADDGKADTGDIIGITGMNPQTGDVYISACESGSDYLVASTGISNCTFWYMLPKR